MFKKLSKFYFSKEEIKGIFEDRENHDATSEEKKMIEVIVKNHKTGTEEKYEGDALLGMIRKSYSLACRIDCWENDYDLRLKFDLSITLLEDIAKALIMLDPQSSHPFYHHLFAIIKILQKGNEKLSEEKIISITKNLISSKDYE
jgi:hypothetical protein